MPSIKPADGEEELDPIDRLRLISTWSIAILAILGVGAALYLAREPLVPVVTAFVVGVMLSPAAQALEEHKVPRLLSATLMVLFTAILIGVVVALIASPMADLAGRLPQLGAKLQVLEDSWRRLELSLGVNPATSSPVIPAPGLGWVPTTLGYLTVPVTGFIYFLVVLLLFISWWPDLRRQLVMTFASRDSRLKALKILNEVEASLAAYLLTVSCINVCVGAAGGAIAWLTGLPFPFGLGALAATLNFIPIVGPILMIVVLALVGLVTAPSFGAGLLPAALFMLAVFLEGQFITPTIIGRRLEINNLAVILSLLFWTWMWGPVGALLASPLLIVGLIVREHLRPDEPS
ncbi:MAG TPA: AI-2E family transporter [Roseiarcus sp.]|nr:AI-2E family transporter [Roseiarcus sp.]